MTSFLYHENIMRYHKKDDIFLISEMSLQAYSVKEDKSPQERSVFSHLLYKPSLWLAQV